MAPAIPHTDCSVPPSAAQMRRPHPWGWSRRTCSRSGTARAPDPMREAPPAKPSTGRTRDHRVRQGAVPPALIQSPGHPPAKGRASAPCAGHACCPLTREIISPTSSHNSNLLQGCVDGPCSDPDPDMRPMQQLAPLGRALMGELCSPPSHPRPRVSAAAHAAVVARRSPRTPAALRRAPTLRPPLSGATPNGHSAPPGGHAPVQLSESLTEVGFQLGCGNDRMLALATCHPHGARQASKPSGVSSPLPRSLASVRKCATDCEAVTATSCNASICE